VEFRILGPLEVLDGDTPVEITGTKRRAVLALLLLHANEIVRTERLIDELWGERTPRNASAALHSHVSRLRKTLGPDVLARREWGYVLRVEEGSIDLRRFEQLVAAAEPLPARERSAKLAEALKLWRGPALADLTAEPGLQSEIARLDELRLTTLERRIDADLEAGRCAELVGEIEALIAAHPLREHLRWQLILALYRAGRQAEALEVYRETRRVLTEELGLEPSPALQELERAILRQDPAIAPASPPEPPASAAREEPPKRRLLLGVLLALGVLGLGVGGAFALVHGTSSHKRMPASQVAASSSGASTSTPGTIAPEAQTTTSGATQAASTPNDARAQTTTSLAAGQAATAKRRRPAHRARLIAHTAATPAVGNSKHTELLRTHTKPRARTNGRALVPKPKQKPSTRTNHAKPVRIADDFSDPQLDALIWGLWDSGTGASAAQQNGQLVFSIAADVTFESQFHGVGVNVGTKCKFPGDFDARVDFALPHWPAGNGASVSLAAYEADPVDLISRTTTSQWGDIYNTFPAQGSVPLSDTSGSLRIARSKGIVRTYLWHHGQWKKLSAQTISGQIWVGMSLGTFADRWQDMNVKATFDNFLVTASDASCPPGSDPRDP
jgi:DNA-binding SARP family transcriptional activator